MLAQTAAMVVTVLAQAGQSDGPHGKVMQFIDQLQAGRGSANPRRPWTCNSPS